MNKHPTTGRPSISFEMLLRAALLQAFFSARSERMLMEQINYNLLFRWFVGAPMDAEGLLPTVFTHNRDRLLEAANQSGNGDLLHERIASLKTLREQTMAPRIAAREQGGTRARSTLPRSILLPS